MTLRSFLYSAVLNLLYCIIAILLGCILAKVYPYDFHHPTTLERVVDWWEKK